MLRDKNDSPPSFHNVSRSHSVSEDALPGYTVGRFVAEDPDTDGVITYRLVEGGDSHFVLDTSNGALTLQTPLDREEKSFYELVIEASDGVQSSQVSINVAIVDSNDNAPVFSKSAYSFDISEDAIRGARVGTVMASDEDDGVNAQIGYSVISDWGNDVFSLNPQTGVFTLTSHLDYEQVGVFFFTFDSRSWSVIRSSGPALPSLGPNGGLHLFRTSLNWSVSFCGRCKRAPSFSRASQTSETLVTSCNLRFELVGTASILMTAVAARLCLIH